MQLLREIYEEKGVVAAAILGNLLSAVRDRLVAAVVEALPGLSLS